MRVAIRNCLLLLFCAVPALCPPLARAQSPQSANPGDDAATYTVPIVARDHSGKAVQDLKPEDLTVFLNGRAAKILGLESAAKVPVRIGILLTGDQSTFKLQQKSAVRLLGTLRPGDQAFVLTQAIKNAHGWPGKRLIWDPDTKALATFIENLHWNEGLESTKVKDICMAMLALNPDKPFRRVMLEFRDPELETSVDYRSMPSKELDDLLTLEVEQYQQRRAIVYTTTLKTLRPLQLGYQEGSVRIERVAVATGGRYLNWDRIEPEVGSILEDLDNEMLVSFEVPPGSAEKPQSVEIRSTRKDVHLAYPNRLYPPVQPK